MSRPRKRYRAKGVNWNAVSLALLGQAFMTPEDQNAIAAPVALAVDQIIKGVATEADWQAVFDVVNVLDRFVTMPTVMRGGRDYLTSIQAVIIGILDRQRETKTRALYPGEIEDLRALLDLWREILSTVTNREFYEAQTRAHARVVSVLRSKTPNPQGRVVRLH